MDNPKTWGVQSLIHTSPPCLIFPSEADVYIDRRTERRKFSRQIDHYYADEADRRDVRIVVGNIFGIECSISDLTFRTLPRTQLYWILMFHPPSHLNLMRSSKDYCWCRPRCRPMTMSWLASMGDPCMKLYPHSFGPAKAIPTSLHLL